MSPDSGSRGQAQHRDGEARSDWRRDPFALVGAYRRVLLAGGVDPATLTDPQLVSGLREFLRLVAPTAEARLDPLAGRAPWSPRRPAMRWVPAGR